jgi:protein SCO1
MDAIKSRTWPTLCACAAVLGLFLWATFALTRGLEHWTFEDLRRDDVRLGRLAAPAIDVRTADGATRALWQGGEPAPVYLLDFIYTTCPTLCQALGSEYARMQARLRAAPPDAAAPQLLSLSFDLERDGRDELAAYAKLHGADARLWTVAAPRTHTGRDALLARLGVVVVADGFGGYVHNGSILVVDGRGTVRGVFDVAQWPQALAAARRVAEAAS